MTKTIPKARKTLSDNSKNQSSFVPLSSIRIYLQKPVNVVLIVSYSFLSCNLHLNEAPFTLFAPLTQFEELSHQASLGVSKPYKWNSWFCKKNGGCLHVLLVTILFLCEGDSSNQACILYMRHETLLKVAEKQRLH